MERPFQTMRALLGCLKCVRNQAMYSTSSLPTDDRLGQSTSTHRNCNSLFEPQNVNFTKDRIFGTRRTQFTSLNTHTYHALQFTIRHSFDSNQKSLESLLCHSRSTTTKLKNEIEIEESAKRKNGRNEKSSSEFFFNFLLSALDAVNLRTCVCCLLCQSTTMCLCMCVSPSPCRRSVLLSECEL